MGLLVSIDNGGTLTDVCATDGVSTIHAKTLTTPHDLTECFVKCLEALSEKIDGEIDLPKLVGSIDYIRYSTTQGTNAIVQRKGPRIGLLTDDEALLSAAMNAAPGLFESFVADRVRIVAPSAVAEAAGNGAGELVMAVSKLVSAGAGRVVIALSGADAVEREKAAKRILYRAFPRHLLGAVPLLFSTELTKIGAPEQRVWASLINAFLHPAMEKFLYNAENKLREHRARKPLLIFRNDGNSTRVAKTVAIKTYSSGPQGGVVGAEVLLSHYGVPSAVSMDIGGTTTDIAKFEDGVVRVNDTGRIEGAPVAIPLSEIDSIGAGGGSILRAESGKVLVGPESVGSAPGPACFARGGTMATMTDAFLVMGILDPQSYFGGRMPLDRERAERAIMTHIGEPLGLGLSEAVDAMADAYHGKIAASLAQWSSANKDAVLLAFGGAGPMSACGVAEKAGLKTALIPKFAAVFSAYGIAFSDIEHSYMAGLTGGGSDLLGRVRDDLAEQARRGMLAEGFDLAECTLDYALLTRNGTGYVRAPLNGAVDGLNAEAWMELRVRKPIDRIRLAGAGFDEKRKATPEGTRQGRDSLPLFRLENLAPGDWFKGPCLVEEAFFTAHVRPGWRFVVSGNGDLFLRRDRE
ncbi:hydantoinase/oxoprolinase family protein [uncultured Parvibaculum sp.]|uniref:hydantoinase/oxoprolinase family protein n=1 Tax=uncultured Parvibaculum sp. TaxID=291828 RepID=UPI0030DA002C